MKIISLLQAYKKKLAGPLGFFISPLYYDGKATEHFTWLAGERRKVSLSESVWAIDYGVG